MEAQAVAGIKLKRTTRGLDVVQSVYAFAMALGLTDVFLGSRTYLNEVVFGAGPADDARSVLLGLCLVNALLLGLRFFWAPRNLASLVREAAECRLRGTRPGELDLSSRSVALHLVVIFIHGALFFMICDEFEQVAFLSSSGTPSNASIFNGLITLQICLLLLNAAWIAATKHQEGRIRRSAGIDEDDLGSTGSIWWINNLVCALFAAAPLAVVSGCQSAVGDCLAVWTDLGSQSFNPLPASPQVITTAFGGLDGLLDAVGSSPSSPALVWALSILLLNSLVDLVSTGRDYVLFEDAEWDDAAPLPSRTQEPGQ